MCSDPSRLTTAADRAQRIAGAFPLRCRRRSGRRRSRPAPARRTARAPGARRTGRASASSSRSSGAEVAVGRGGERLLDEVVARDVDRVHPVHRVGVRTQRAPALPARRRSPARSRNSAARRLGVAARGGAEQRGRTTCGRRGSRAAARAARRPGRRPPRRRGPSGRPSLARMPADQAASYRAPERRRGTPTASATACSWSSWSSGSSASASRARFHCGDDRLVAVGVAPAVVDRAVDRGRVVGLHERARPVVDGLARDRHVVGVHHAVDEADEHPLRDQRRLGGDDRLEQREVGLLGVGGGRVVPGDRVVGEAAQQVDVAGGAAYWKLPTRRWLLATRASTAPGSRVSRRTGRPVATTARERVVGMPRACIASLTTYSRSIGPTAARPSPPRANGVRPEPFRCRSRRRPVGVDELAEQQRPAVAEPRGVAAELVPGVGLRHRGRHRRGRGCRPAAAARRGCAASAGSRPSSAASGSLSASSARLAAPPRPARAAASSGSSSAKRWPRRRTGPAVTLTRPSLRTRRAG